MSVLCETCDTIENEYHVIFICPKYNSVRVKYPNLLTGKSISEFLDPVYNDMKGTALFLHEIEEIRK